MSINLINSDSSFCRIRSEILSILFVSSGRFNRIEDWVGGQFNQMVLQIGGNNNQISYLSFKLKVLANMVFTDLG